jgi:DNA repair protein RadC
MVNVSKVTEKEGPIYKSVIEDITQADLQREAVLKARFGHMLPEEVEIVRNAMKIIDTYMFSREHGIVIDNVHKVVDYLKLRIGANTSECFCVIFLDSGYRVIAFEEIFHGTVSSCNAQSREVIRQTLRYNATAVILSHNHPSGITRPSEQDFRVTEEILIALNAINVTLLDHVIVGEGYFSFSENYDNFNKPKSSPKKKTKKKVATTPAK